MSSPENQIVTCHQCGAKNRIPVEKIAGSSAKCGRCGTSISISSPHSDEEAVYKLRCGHCKTRNRIPAIKLNQNPKCGKCGNLIETVDILSGRPVMVTDANFDEKVAASPLPVLMYAWAPWCSGCQHTGPIIEQFAVEAAGKVRVAKLNVDGNPSLAAKYSILSVPFLFIFDKGELQESFPGGPSKHDIMLKMAHYI